MMQLVLKKSLLRCFEIRRSYILKQVSLLSQKLVILVKLIDLLLQSNAYMSDETLTYDAPLFHLRLIAQVDFFCTLIIWVVLNVKPSISIVLL